METGHLHDSTTDHTGLGAPAKLSIALYVCSWLFLWLETLSADVIWTWTFRILSGISLLLIIYINWNKAIDIFRTKKKKSPKVNDEG